MNTDQGILHSSLSLLSNRKPISKAKESIQLFHVGIYGT